ncbi:predicted protein [Lichtheimia corymbifera JMRC:FSU:9682]|uniref:Uncharacterized protein n=1 Tax=Lichtheimia corymbifera JMRC:FSU:9682 TaxID=1263082 RepID=A0A068S3E4_9FUNG|nr:predicted protein [Lichtheimia corymbifera JMRC:FSU:9682]
MQRGTFSLSTTPSILYTEAWYNESLNGKHKGACISKLYNEAWGLQWNKVARLGEAHLGCKFHDQPLIHPMSPPASSKKIQEVDLRSTLAGGDIAKLGIGHDDCETCTVDPIDPAEQLCSMKEPTLHSKV